MKELKFIFWWYFIRVKSQWSNDQALSGNASLDYDSSGLEEEYFEFHLFLQKIVVGAWVSGLMRVYFETVETNGN